MATMATTPKGVRGHIPAHGGARAHGHGQEEGGRHRAGGHAAGVKGDGGKNRRHRRASAQAPRHSPAPAATEWARRSGCRSIASPTDTDTPTDRLNPMRARRRWRPRSARTPAGSAHAPRARPIPRSIPSASPAAPAASAAPCPRGPVPGSCPWA